MNRSSPLPAPSVSDLTTRPGGGRVVVVAIACCLCSFFFFCIVPSRQELQRNLSRKHRQQHLLVLEADQRFLWIEQRLKKRRRRWIGFGWASMTLLESYGLSFLLFSPLKLKITPPKIKKIQMFFHTLRVVAWTKRQRTKRILATLNAGEWSAWR